MTLCQKGVTVFRITRESAPCALLKMPERFLGGSCLPKKDVRHFLQSARCTLPCNSGNGQPFLATSHMHSNRFETCSNSVFFSIGTQGARAHKNTRRRQEPPEPEARLELSKPGPARTETPRNALGLADRLSSRDSRGLANSELRIPPASCSNHGEEVARPLSRRDHRASAC